MKNIKCKNKNKKVTMNMNKMNFNLLINYIYREIILLELNKKNNN